MEFRLLARDEIGLIWTIDRREVIENTYRVETGELRIEPRHIDVPGWSSDKAPTMTPRLYESFDRDAAFFAAFDKGALVGVAVVGTIWRGANRDRLELEFLHVSRDFRSRGVASHLFEQSRGAARARGARGLYISATPSENTINFYTRHGSTLLATPDADLFALEPEDIHLECPA